MKSGNLEITEQSFKGHKTLKVSLKDVGSMGMGTIKAKIILAIAKDKNAVAFIEEYIKENTKTESKKEQNKNTDITSILLKSLTTAQQKKLLKQLKEQRGF